MSATESVSDSDRAFLAALAARAGAESPALLLRLGHQRARALSEIIKSQRDDESDPIATFRLLHESQLRPDPSQVHWSWYARALKDESPAVQRVVAGAASEPLRSNLLHSLKLSPIDLQTDRPPDPEIVGIVQVLWTERLIGDHASSEDATTSIATIMSLPPRRFARLVRLAGLAKLSILPETDRVGHGTRSTRIDFSSRPIDDPRLVKLAQNDWTTARSAGRHAIAALGLSSLGRLLGQGDSYRVRWALQHLPYPIAKRLRSFASGPQASIKAVVEWEARFVEVASAGLAAFDRDRRPTS